MKKVMAFGTFDGLHLGHLDFFKQVRKYGDYLIAVVARDKTVKKVKNHFPLRNEKERLKIVRNQKLVNRAILGNLKNPYAIIKKIKPDAICLGYDQKVFTRDLPKELKKINLPTKIYRLKSYQPKKYHSSKIDKR
ncbi:MAG: adenylyltransferase/cytidyltransferase family protein [bacterium]